MVKALAWQEMHPFEYRAQTQVGYTYLVRKPRHQRNMPKEWEVVWTWYLVKGEFSKSRVFKTEDDAKAFANAHFADIVLSCLVR